MAFWLRRLSAVFLLAGAAIAGFVLLRDPQSPPGTFRLRPEGRAVVAQLTAALAARTDAASDKASAHSGEVKLPFIVVEPEDFSAPQLVVPEVGVPPVAVRAPGAQLRLVQSPNDQTLDLNPVEARLRTRVPPEVVRYFDLFLYVSKSTPDKGGWAQRMFVLAKDREEKDLFQLLYTWPVSTGKEELVEAPSGKKLGTHTPSGMFKLDRHRFFEDYTSQQWRSPMPSAMFFDWDIEGRRSGLAIHGSSAEGERDLGKRASHGCIRLSAENARVLFDLIRSEYRGRVPLFAIDPETGTMSTNGALVRDGKGAPRLVRGYKVLVFIEDFGGPSVDTVAALY